MDRIEFIEQALQGICVSLDDAVNYFDRVMSTYEVAETMKDASVQSSVTDNLHSSLKIKFSSLQPSELEDVVGYVNDTLHNHKSVYGKSFSMQAIHEDGYVEIAVREDQILK